VAKRTDLDYLHDLVVKVDGRLDDLDIKMEQVNGTLIKHDINLELHMKRSDQNEEAVEMLKAHVNRVNGIIAFVGFVAIVVSIYSALK
jgi:hypothetical protein